VVALYIMLAHESEAKSTEVLNKIELWLISGRMLFVMLLEKLAMDKAILEEVDDVWGHYSKGSLQMHDPIEAVTDEDYEEPHWQDLIASNPMRFEIKKPSPNSNSGIGVLLEV
jgi:hypothetical protein